MRFGKASAGIFIRLEKVGEQTISPLNQTQERFSQAAHPPLHGSDVAVTRADKSKGMCMPETNHITPLFLSLQDPGPIEIDARRSSMTPSVKPSKPDISSPAPYQDATLFV